MKGLRLGLQQTQKLSLTPQLQYAIQLLQLSGLELTERLEKEIEENPFLLEEPEGEEKKPEKEEAFESGTFEWFEDSSDLGYLSKNKNWEQDSNKQLFLENVLIVQERLYDFLLSQLRLLDLSDEEFYLCEILISSLDGDGYFAASLEEIADSLEIRVEKLEELLKVVQTLEPSGIGGRSLKEVLLIQLREKNPENEELLEIIEKDWELFKRKDYKAIGKKYKKTLEQSKILINSITELEPIPARQFSGEKIRYIVPEVTVKKFQDHFAVFVNDSFLPKVHLNDSYQKMIKKEAKNSELKEFFQQKLSEAKFLLFGLEKRKSTIFKIVLELVEYQKEFFEKGATFLKPLTLKDIALRTELHESTVSRVTSNKYIQTSWGIFRLKYFFSGTLPHGSGGESTRSIKEKIKALILKEDSPLNDGQIVQILAEEGIQIARRTVAKYRKSLGIESSFHRKAAI